MEAICRGRGRFVVIEGYEKVAVNRLNGEYDSVLVELTLFLQSKARLERRGA